MMMMMMMMMMRPHAWKCVVRLRGSFRQKTPRAEARIQQHSFTGTAFSQYPDNISKQDVMCGILSAVQFSTQMTSAPREHIRAAAKEAFENRNRYYTQHQCVLQLPTPSACRHTGSYGSRISCTFPKPSPATKV
ncbi:hypothetical protein TRVL_09218 [Trypanosoma vivax]|nr:hypothetical protein TRVL_09218 [Trypanosoma vivax]